MSKLGLLVATFLVGFAAQARTAISIHPDGNWALVIIESRVSGWGGEPLCTGSDALRLFDALKVRPELGTDSVVRLYEQQGVRVKCENVRQFGFVSCSLTVDASPFVKIDPNQSSFWADWRGEAFKSLSALWDTSCAGRQFQTEDGRFQMNWGEDGIQWSYRPLP